MHKAGCCCNSGQSKNKAKNGYSKQQMGNDNSSLKVNIDKISFKSHERSEDSQSEMSVMFETCEVCAFQNNEIVFSIFSIEQVKVA